MTYHSFETGRFAKSEPDLSPAREAGGTATPAASLATRRDGSLASFCSVQQQGGAAAEALRRDYGLTAAETRVAIALADGMPVADICTSQKIGLTTVRSHLKSIFRKTDTRGQVQLVVLVFKLLRESTSAEGGETLRQSFGRSA